MFHLQAACIVQMENRDEEINAFPRISIYAAVFFVYLMLVCFTADLLPSGPNPRFRQ
jgi:hypothetical protein